MNQLNQMNNFDKNQNLDEISDENSYKKFLELEQEQQKAQLNKLLSKQQTGSLDENYIRKGEQEEDSTDNEELNTINQCQLDSNYTSNQINQINLQTSNTLHLTNGLGEVYTIPEETEDEELTSPDSVKIKKNLETNNFYKIIPNEVELNDVMTLSQIVQNDNKLMQSQNLIQTMNNLESRNPILQDIKIDESLTQIEPQIQQISNQINQTVENHLIQTNDSEKYDLISTHRKLPKTGQLYSADHSTTVITDQWDQKFYTSTSMATNICKTAAITSTAISQTTLTEQQSFSRGKN